MTSTERNRLDKAIHALQKVLDEKHPIGIIVVNPIDMDRVLTFARKTLRMRQPWNGAAMDPPFTTKDKPKSTRELLNDALLAIKEAWRP